MIQIKSNALRYFLRHVIYLRYLTLPKLINIFRCVWEYLCRRKYVRSQPFIYIIDITNACNLKCPVCIQSAGTIKRNVFLDFHEFEKIIARIRHFAVKIKLYNWGEPLLHPDINKMVRTIRDSNIGCEISTNLNGKFDISGLLDAGPDMVIISVDSIQQNTYKLIRNQGSFDTLVSNIRTLLSAKSKSQSRVWVDLQFIISKANEAEVENLTSSVKSMFDFSQINSLTIGSMALNLYHKDHRDWLSNSKEYNQYATDAVIGRKYNCPWLYFFRVISPDLKVYPCCRTGYLEENVMGFQSSKASDLLNNANFTSARGIFSDRTSTKITPCHHCFGIYRCTNRDFLAET